MEQVLKDTSTAEVSDPVTDAEKVLDSADPKEEDAEPSKDNVDSATAETQSSVTNSAGDIATENPGLDAADEASEQNEAELESAMDISEGDAKNDPGQEMESDAGNKLDEELSANNDDDLKVEEKGGN